VTLLGVSQSLHQHYLRGGGRISFDRNLCLGAPKKRVLHLARHKSQITNLRLRYTNTNEMWERSIVRASELPNPSPGLSVAQAAASIEIFFP